MRHFFDQHKIVRFAHAGKLNALNTAQASTKKLKRARSIRRFLARGAALERNADAADLRQRQQIFHQNGHPGDGARQDDIERLAQRGHVTGFLGAGVDCLDAS